MKKDERSRRSLPDFLFKYYNLTNPSPILCTLNSSGKSTWVVWPVRGCRPPTLQPESLGGLTRPSPTRHPNRSLGICVCDEPPLLHPSSLSVPMFRWLLRPKRTPNRTRGEKEVNYFAIKSFIPSGPRFLSLSFGVKDPWTTPVCTLLPADTHTSVPRTYGLTGFLFYPKPTNPCFRLWVTSETMWHYWTGEEDIYRRYRGEFMTNIQLSTPTLHLLMLVNPLIPYTNKLWTSM